MEIKEYKQEATREMMDLLLTADPDEAAVRRYLPRSRVLVCYEEECCIGIALLDTSMEIMELKNIAVAESHQGRGMAKTLIGEVMGLAKALGAAQIEIGTGNSSLSQLALYQKCGFRMSHIDRDFFAGYPEPIYENGIRCIDMVRLRATL